MVGLADAFRDAICRKAVILPRRSDEPTLARFVNELRRQLRTGAAPAVIGATFGLSGDAVMCLIRNQVLGELALPPIDDFKDPLDGASICGWSAVERVDLVMDALATSVAEVAHESGLPIYQIVCWRGAVSAAIGHPAHDSRYSPEHRAARNHELGELVYDTEIPVKVAASLMGLPPATGHSIITSICGTVRREDLRALKDRTGAHTLAELLRLDPSAVTLTAGEPLTPEVEPSRPQESASALQGPWELYLTQVPNADRSRLLQIFGTSRYVTALLDLVVSDPSAALAGKTSEGDRLPQFLGLTAQTREALGLDRPGHGSLGAQVSLLIRMITWDSAAQNMRSDGAARTLISALESWTNSSRVNHLFPWEEDPFEGLDSILAHQSNQVSDSEKLQKKTRVPEENRIRGYSGATRDAIVEAYTAALERGPVSPTRFAEERGITRGALDYWMKEFAPRAAELRAQHAAMARRNQTERDAAKRRHRKKREAGIRKDRTERDRAIFADIQEGGLTHAEIAKKHDVSTRKIDRVKASSRAERKLDVAENWRSKPRASALALMKNFETLVLMIDGEMSDYSAADALRISRNAVRARWSLWFDESPSVTRRALIKMKITSFDQIFRGIQEGLL
ncbi:MAG: hypothetical protein ACRC0L_01150, partial [Angustibacter sp.]